MKLYWDPGTCAIGILGSQSVFETAPAPNLTETRAVGREKVEANMKRDMEQ